jgi:DNA-binding FrmR family transcriptional regulator
MKDNPTFVENRLNILSGHALAVGRMIEEGQDFNKIMIQIKALKGSVKNLEKVVIENHLKNSLSKSTKSREIEKVLNQILEATDLKSKLNGN